MRFKRAAMLSERAWAEIARSLKLSRCELEITRGVFDNLTEGAIAAELGVSEQTIRKQLKQLFKKLRVTTRTQMIVRVTHELLFLAVSELSCPPSSCRIRGNDHHRMQD